MAGTDKQEWQDRVGKSWAAEWRRTDRSFTTLTAELLRRISNLTFESVLDVGCGSGYHLWRMRGEGADFVLVDADG
mgnify:CR=1 FL=1